MVLFSSLGCSFTDGSPLPSPAFRSAPLLPMYRLDDDGAPDLTFATTGDEPFPDAALQPPQIDASWLCTLLLDVKKYE
jgi:hypothetical protein